MSATALTALSMRQFGISGRAAWANPAIQSEISLEDALNLSHIPFQEPATPSTDPLEPQTKKVCQMPQRLLLLYMFCLSLMFSIIRVLQSYACKRTTSTQALNVATMRGTFHRCLSIYII